MIFYDKKDPKKQQDNRSEWEKTWIPTQIPDVPEPNELSDIDTEPETEELEPEKEPEQTTNEPECGAYLEDADKEDPKEEEDPIEVVGSYSYEDEEPSCVLMWCKNCKLEFTGSHDCEDFKTEIEEEK